MARIPLLNRAARRTASFNDGAPFPTKDEPEAQAVDHLSLALPARSLLGRIFLRPAALLLVALVSFLAGQGCMPPDEQGSGPGHRRQILGLTPEQEYGLG